MLVVGVQGLPPLTEFLTYPNVTPIIYSKVLRKSELCWLGCIHTPTFELKKIPPN
jgi:hypothetical protein